jgi:hypothetical protein
MRTVRVFEGQPGHPLGGNSEHRLVVEGLARLARILRQLCNRAEGRVHHAGEELHGKSGEQTVDNSNTLGGSLFMPRMR